ncbi:MAG: ATP-dependent RecD-like DNA helicase [Thermoanaerobaculales bacterium]|nr:ATP-dependent RecD-like DNA helicase [Thermoanaerobaculales bacterium]
MPDSALDLRQSTEGRVTRILFSNEENGWCVVRLQPEGAPPLTAIGPFLGVREGDDLRLSGRWVDHPRYGRQFEAESYLQIEPSTLDGLKRFLGSGKIRGLGPKRAAAVVDAFGLDALGVIEHEPEKLRAIRGIGPATLGRIRDSWAQYRGIQQVMVFLTGHGVSPGVAIKVFRRYGVGAVDAVRANPYRLAEEIFGVGFLTADRIARQLGVPESSPERRAAGILHTLREAAGGQGHVYLPEDQLLAAAGQLLGEEPAALGAALADLAARQQVRLAARPESPAAVYLPRLEQAEARTAADLLAIVSAPASGEPVMVDLAVAWFQAQSRLRLASGQRRALAVALRDKVAVITGGPGTGKTTLVRGLVQVLERKGARLALAAPTGRAAKRLSEATGQAATTIHRLLEYNPVSHGFNRCRENPIEADCLVVDEVSMLDIELASSLLEAVPPGCRLVLVGDSDQLPSVGPGNVLADLIASGRVPVVRLDEVFRQAGGSLIVVNAHRVNAGQMPRLDPDAEQVDFFFIPRDDPAEAAELAVDLAARRLPKRYGLDPVSDIQVLAPMHRGELGVIRLNERLQDVLTPPGRELVVGWRRFRVGDKVMQVRNNYELDVFNGDLGRIEAIDHGDREIAVRFDDRTVVVAADDLEDVVPAYACTIHKAQGSEYPAVVVVLHHQHHVMLQRNLLYTAITRGQRLVVIVGSNRALARAVGNATIRARYSLLAQRLADPPEAGTR